MSEPSKQETEPSAKRACVRQECLTIASPDDFHLHLRDGDGMASVVGPAARQFGRALVMPNLKPPVVNAAMALAYRTRILDALKAHDPTLSFVPLMSLYLTDQTTCEDIVQAKASGHVYACKLYPAGATTNSDNGVTDVTKIYPVLDQMAKSGILLLVHSEVTDQSVDIFEREAVFIERVLRPLVARSPSLKVVMEHVTTKAAVDFVLECGPNVAATITAHHLLYNRNRLFLGGLCPHYYCLPVLKTETDRVALVKAATSGNPKFFAGTDSAPHAKGKKETSCGCAGCYTSFAALELYAEAFDLDAASASGSSLGRLEGFVSRHGSTFYGLPHNEGTVTLKRERWTAPSELPFGDSVVVPLRAGEAMAMQWKVSPKE